MSLPSRGEARGDLEDLARWERHERDHFDDEDRRQDCEFCTAEDAERERAAVQKGE